MKRREVVLATVGLLLCGGLAIGQSPPAKLLLSFQRVTTHMESSATGGGQVRSTDPNQGMVAHYPTTSMCLLVYGDGSYYLEKMEEKSLGKPKIRAFNGRLAPAELEQLQAIVTEQGFRSVSSPAPVEQPDDATYLKEGEVIEARIVRQDGTQEFNLSKKRYATTSMSGVDKLVSNWQALEKRLKPFLSWVKDAEKSGQSGAKEVESTSCPTVVSN